MNKTITKAFLSLSMCLCYTAGNVSNIHAASLNTSGVKTEYEMLELQRNKGNSGSSNILSNGDFEQGSKRWTIKNDAVITNEKDSNENKGFTHSQYYGVVKGADSTLSQKITVSSNKNYAAQARVKIGHAGESVRFVVYDDSNTLFKESVVGYDESLKGTYQTVNININSENYTQLNVALIGVNGDVCVDNVIFTPFTSKGIMDPGVVEDGDFINRSNRWKTTGDGKIQKHEGNDSGYLLSWSGNASVYQEVSLKPNTEYTLKADVLIAKAGAYGFLAVKTPNVENLNPAVEKTVKCTKDQEWTWQQVELKFNSRNNTSVSVCFLKWLDNADRNQNNATFMSQMIVDNVELVEGKSEVQEVEDENYTVLWADEFNGNQKNTDSNGLDVDNWGYELGCVRGVEQQHYVKDNANVHINDGKLVLEVTDRKKEDQYKNPRGNRQVIYNSGSVRTHGKREFLFGRIEVLAKLPKGQATFPAFWTLGADFTLDGSINGDQGDGWPMSGEIDIMESIGNPNVVYETLHYNNGSGNGNDDGKYAGNGKTTAITTPGRVIDGEVYHVYGINWSAGKMEWYIDDQIVRSVDYSDDPAALKALDRPQYIQLNFATGGNWPGDAGKNLAGQQFKVEYAYYAQNEKQAASAKKYYENTVSVNAKDMIIKKGTEADLLKNVTLKAGSDKVNVDDYTIDYSIDNEHMFTTSPDLTDESTSNDEARTRVDCLVRTNDPKEIAKLPAGEYNLHISAMHKSKPSVRKTVKLTIVASADYTKLTKAVNKANALDKSLYKDFSKVEDALNNVKYDLDITKQSEVNAMTKALEDAMAGLEYKDADYTKLNEAVNKAKSLDKTLYVDFSAVEDALDNVKYDLDITKQSEVNAMTKTLEDAMAGLEYKDADYTKLNEAVNKAKSLDKTLYVDFSAVESALNNVKYDLDITKQSEVDAMTKALEDAVAKLEKKITIDTTDKTDPKPSDKNDQKPSDKSDSKTDTTVKTGDTTNVLPMFISVIVTLLGIFLLKRKKA